MTGLRKINGCYPIVLLPGRPGFFSLLGIILMVPLIPVINKP